MLIASKTRTQASVRLDLNLEKGRIRDELGLRELKIREVDTRIEGEIGNLRTTMESVKFNMLVCFAFHLVPFHSGISLIVIILMALVFNMW